MARPIKANTQSSRLKVITLGDESRTLMLPESGATVIITSAATAARTITLPKLSGVNGTNGAFYRLIWGVATTAANWIITTNRAAELIRGTVMYYNTEDDNEGSNAMAQHVSDASVAGGDDNDRVITLSDDVFAGTTIELVSDGSHWYVANSAIISDADPAFS